LSPRHLVTLSCLLLACGCDPPGKPKPGDQPVPADKVSNFDVLYATHCAACHGADGRLGPAPPLNDPIFLAIVPESQLLRVIRDGRGVTPGQKSPMPAFTLPRLTPDQEKALAELKDETHAHPRQQGPLTDEQARILAEGIPKRWGPPAPADPRRPSYLATAGGGNRSKGMDMFVRACADCHGPDGRGGKYGDRPVGAVNDPAFLALTSDQALRRYVITGRPDLGMPPYDGKAGRPETFEPLTSEDVDNLVALLADWRRGGLTDGK
jgi:cytochrome c oxidase cbb3-type subunit 3